MEQIETQLRTVSNSVSATTFRTKYTNGDYPRILLVQG